MYFATTIGSSRGTYSCDQLIFTLIFVLGFLFVFICTRKSVAFAHVFPNARRAQIRSSSPFYILTQKSCDGHTHGNVPWSPFQMFSFKFVLIVLVFFVDIGIGIWLGICIWIEQILELSLTWLGWFTIKIPLPRDEATGLTIQAPAKKLLFSLNLYLSYLSFVDAKFWS